MEYIFVINGLSKTYGPGKDVLKDIRLSFLPGAKIGVVGLNGAGKSTLLRIMAGIDQDFNGEAWPARGVKLGYLPQEPRLQEGKTVDETISEAFSEKKALLDRFNAISARFGEEIEEKELNQLLEEQGELQEKIDTANAWELERKIEVASEALRCPPGDQKVDGLSGGEARRVALCRLLLEEPDLLLLDEPTNHLDAESVAWLERYLREYKGTLITVTHDRYFLDNIVGWILELDRGRGIPFEGNYSQWLEQRENRWKQEETSETGRQAVLASELEWIRSGTRGRHKKAKARITAYEKLLAVAAAAKPVPGKITIPPAPRLGNLVIEADNLTKAYGDRILFEAAIFKVPPGALIGVIGPNGAGKTTLFRLLSGEESPDSGRLKVGESVKLGYVDQKRDCLDAKKTVWEEISGGLDAISLGRTTLSSRAYVGSFNFKGSDQQKKVGDLSGGERNRVHLAKMLTSGANVLLLDEPTNDLDVDTLRALEEALLGFTGSALVISHDRWFLDRISTHILAFEGGSTVLFFEGNYSEFEADKKARLGKEGLQPHRLKYKKLRA